MRSSNLRNTSVVLTTGYGHLPNRLITRNSSNPHLTRYSVICGLTQEPGRELDQSRYGTAPQPDLRE